VDHSRRRLPPAAALDRADPPSALYVADEKPDVIAATVPAGWKQIGRCGASRMGHVLQAHGVDSPTAASAAAGWGGDRVLLLGADSVTTGVALLTFDTDLDAAEAWQALSYALDDLVVGAGSTSTDQRRWLTPTAGHRRRAQGAAIAVITGAPLPSWRALLDDVWRWRVTR
jgi:hypothetical protein